jgi:type II secretory pathway component PulF
MPLYHWKGLDARGIEQSGTSHSETIDQLRTKLFDNNIALLSHKEAGTSAEFLKKLIPKQRVTLSDIASFFEDIAVLLKSGIPLLTTLSLVQNYTPSKRLKKIIENLAYQVEHGNALSRAMESHKEIFSEIIIQIIRAGEASGTFDESLTHVATYLKKRAELLQKLKSAAIPPAITLGFAFCIITGLSIFVVPHLEPLLKTGNHQTSAGLLLAISKTLESEYVRLSIGLTLIGLLITLQYLKKINSGIIVDYIVLKTPLIGNMVLYSNLAHFSNTLALMLKTGTPLATSLKLAGKTCSNKVLAKEIEHAALAIGQGEPLSRALGKHFPDFFIASLSLGERTGQLEIMVEKCGNLVEKKVLKQISLVSALFQPLLLIGVGIFIAFLLLSLYMPILNIANIG